MAAWPNMARASLWQATSPRVSIIYCKPVWRRPSYDPNFANHPDLETDRVDDQKSVVALHPLLHIHRTDLCRAVGARPDRQNHLRPPLGRLCPKRRDLFMGHDRAIPGDRSGAFVRGHWL